MTDPTPDGPGALSPEDVPMRLHVLGCRGGMPADGQPSSGYLLEAGRTQLLLDCGPGVATALSAHSSGVELAAVVISHLHLDHCHDLLPLGKTLLRHAFPDAAQPQAEPVEMTVPRREPTPLYVPRGAREVLDRWAELFPVTTVPLLDRAFGLAFDVREYVPGQSVAVGALDIEPHLLRHASANCGMRITSGGTSLAYTGDTGLHHGLDALAAGVDVLLAECSLERTDTSGHGHLCAEDVARIATGAGVGALVLTHFSSADPAVLQRHHDLASAIYSGPISLAAPGAVFDIETHPIPVEAWS